MLVLAVGLLTLANRGLGYVRSGLRAFLTEDPRRGLDWSSEIWTAIEDTRVVVGMTAAQARMSWGDPRRIEHVVAGAGREERWLYLDHPTVGQCRCERRLGQRAGAEQRGKARVG